MKPKKASLASHGRKAPARGASFFLSRIELKLNEWCAVFAVIRHDGFLF
jgi:hypothetical protein